MNYYINTVSVKKYHVLYFDSFKTAKYQLLRIISIVKSIIIKVLIIVTFSLLKYHESYSNHNHRT